jgi:5-methylcytosine-specific restriction enzyme A
MTVRKEFSKKVKLAAWQRSGGICECGCGVKIITGVEYDHIVEDTLGGEPTLENCRVMSKRCHDLKTRTRRPEIDKTNRVFEKRINARKKSRPIPGSKASGYRHKMNGDWVKR